MGKLIIANWKMNKTNAEAREFMSALGKVEGKDKIVICPSFTMLDTVGKSAKKAGVSLGAQNMAHVESGAVTGEVSVLQLKELGVGYVLIGHSERRQGFYETATDSLLKKVRLAIKHGLIPIFCIGEDDFARNPDPTHQVGEDFYKKFLQSQLMEILDLEDVGGLVVAYEPVWAIGTGKVATTEQIEETHAYIRGQLQRFFPGKKIPLLYGGSVNEKNAAEIMALKNVGGVLVGGASLCPESFAKICGAIS